MMPCADVMAALQSSIKCVDDGWRALGCAIILQAAKDKAEWFFRDGGSFNDNLIEQVLPDISKEKLWNQIETNYEQNGSWRNKEKKPKWWEKKDADND